MRNILILCIVILFSGNIAAKSNYVEGSFIVSPRAGLPAEVLGNILENHDGTATKIGQSDLYVVNVRKNTEKGTVALLKHNPHLKFVELDEQFALAFIPNDPLYPSAWHLPNIDAHLAWDISFGAGVPIAILDTGTNRAHEDLSTIDGWNFYDNNSDTTDVHGHGTLTAGSAGAIGDNGIGVAGVSIQSSIMPLRIADLNGYGRASHMASALVYAADRGIRLASISYANVPGNSTVINASKYMKDRNGLVFVSAGNGGVDEQYVDSPWLIAVSATGSNNVRPYWSSYGNYVDIAAPGVSIWTTDRNGGYRTASGTSFSSPIAAGVAALMMSANPSLSSLEIESLLFSTADYVGDPFFYGNGKVNAGAAVLAAANAPKPIPDTEKPVVYITEPLGGETVSGLVLVDLVATDNVGVTRTELFINDNSVAIDTSTPFAFTWDSKGTANGLANITVRAFDEAGNNALSEVVEVTVYNEVIVVPKDTEPPIVAIINPIAGDVSKHVIITINASDNSADSDIVIDVYINEEFLSTGTGSTFSTKWNTHPKNITAGDYTIRAVATDAAGNASETSVVVTLNK